MQTPIATARLSGSRSNTPRSTGEAGRACVAPLARDTFSFDGAPQEGLEGIAPVRLRTFVAAATTRLRRLLRS